MRMNNKVISIGILFLFLMLSLFLQGCGSTGSSNVIKIAVAGPMTGDSAQYGESMKLGVDMAVDEINAKGGILGKNIQVSYEDDKGNPGEAVNVAQRISSDNNTVAVIGHFLTSCTLAASPVYQKVGLPEMAVASTNAAATSAGNYIFRVNVTNTAQGAGIMQWLAKVQDKKRIAILYVNDDYGKGIADQSRETAKELGMDVVYDGAVESSGEQDYTVPLTSAKAANPDALVIFAYYAACAKMLIQADTLALNVLKVASDAAYAPDLINIAGKSAEGVYVATWFHPDSNEAGTRKFVKAFETKYKKESDSWSPYAYDAMYVIAKGIEKAGKVDRKALRDALAKTKDFNGATGIITFNDQRVPDPSSKTLLFTVIKYGKFELLK